MPASKYKAFSIDQKFILEHGKSAKVPNRSSVNFNL